MILNKLEKIKNIKKSKRLGRGESSGKGKTAAKGMKGQKSRGRGKIRLGFEGGQLPLIKRLPFRRGVGNNKPKLKITITLDQLKIFNSGDRINTKSLAEKGLLKKTQKPYLVKIVAKGELTKALEVEVATTTKAKELIENAKGKVLEPKQKEEVNA